MRTLCKKLIMIILGVFIMPIGIVYAKIPAEQVAIGGITYKATIDYIISIYGQPSRVKSGIYYWGKDESLVVTTWDPAKGQTNHATSITCSAANGLETPVGGAVGMPVDNVMLRYGRNAGSAPDYIDYENEVYGYISDNGCLIYRARNGKIVKIEIVGYLN